MGQLGAIYRDGCRVWVCHGCSTFRCRGYPLRRPQRFKPIYLFLLNKWYFDELYDVIFVQTLRSWLGRVLWKGGDGAIIDGIGPDGVAARVLDVTGRVVKLQSGYVYHYAFVMMIGVALDHHLLHVRQVRGLRCNDQCRQLHRSFRS